MRVLMVANTLPPRDLSGAGEQIVQLGWGLEQRGCQVEHLGRGAGGARGPKVLFPLTAVVPALRRLWRDPPDVIQVHESDGGLVALAIRLLRHRWPGLVLVALQQVSYVEERRAVAPVRDGDTGAVLARPVLRERWFRWLRTPVQILLGRLSARCADLVLAPSERTAEELRRDYRPRRLAVLPNVTGAPILDSGVEDAAPPAQELAPGYLLFVGRLRLRKGVEVLLHALAQSLPLAPGMRLLVAGDGERTVILERLVRQLGLAGNVELLGRCSRSRVSVLLQGAGALVVPSTYEGMPLVILEAMEAGVPVVASAVSGIPEVVSDGETGWIVPSGDVGALAEALVAACSDREEARRRGARGRERLDLLYRPAKAAGLWLDLIAEVSERASAADGGKGR